MSVSVLSWVLRFAAAGILLQILFFKFTAAPESVYIFTKVGLEPWGRIGSAVVELIAAFLILSSRLTWLGCTIALAVVVFVAAAINLFLHLTEIPFSGRKLA